jgi:hypothetical protein
MQRVEASFGDLLRAGAHSRILILGTSLSWGLILFSHSPSIVPQSFILHFLAFAYLLYMILTMSGLHNSLAISSSFILALSVSASLNPSIHPDSLYSPYSLFSESPCSEQINIYIFDPCHLYP